MAETHAVLNVPSVSCNHCKMAIESAVGALAGVGRSTSTSPTRA